MRCLDWNTWESAETQPIFITYAVYIDHDHVTNSYLFILSGYLVMNLGIFCYRVPACTEELKNLRLEVKMCVQSHHLQFPQKLTDHSGGGHLYLQLVNQESYDGAIAIYIYMATKLYKQT